MITSKMGYLLPILLTWVGVSVGSSFDIKYEWKYVDYKWESAAQKEGAIASGRYNLTSLVIFDVQPLPDNRVIVTTPKAFTDNPATISIISKENGPGGPLLAPYPNWSYHTATDCSGITQIRKVVVDDYQRMWAVDTGRIPGYRLCAPKIVVFDLTTDEILQTIAFPDEIELSGNVIVLDVETTGDSLEDVTLYMSDLARGTLLIWNNVEFVTSDDAVFKGVADQAVLDVGGYKLDLLSIGVTGGPSTVETPLPGIFATQDLVFFRPLASKKLYFALGSQWLNRKIESVDYYVSDYTMPHQEITGAVSSSGIRFGSASTEMTITCWNMKNPLTSDYVNYFETDEENLQYISALKVFQPSNDSEELWMLSDRLTRWSAGALDFSDYNYRVIVAKIDDLVTSTVCDPANVVGSPQPASSVEEVAANLKFSLVPSDG